MGENSHVTEQDLKELHQPKGGASQKGCLTRHQKRKEGHLCSHQWQARGKAETDPTVHNYPAYWTLCGDGRFRSAARITEAGNVFPPNYAESWLGQFWKKKPTHKGKEWNLGKGRNFNHYTEPYWHNAHHIIPNGTLSAAIAEAAESAKEKAAELLNLIKAGLLKAEYNLNDKVNMIILPMQKNVDHSLSLPRHLKGDHT